MRYACFAAFALPSVSSHPIFLIKFLEIFILNMADLSSTAPLLQGRSSAPGVQEQLRWYHFILITFAVILIALGILSSLSSFYRFTSVVLTFAILVWVYYHFLWPLKPNDLPFPFLVSQAGLGAFVATLALGLLFALVVLVVIIWVVIIVALIVQLFARLYPNAAHVFFTDLQSLARNISEIANNARLDQDGFQVPLAPSLRAVVQVAQAAPMLQGRMDMRNNTSALYGEQWQQFKGQVWRDMISAGASPTALITTLVAIGIVLLLSAIIGGIGFNGAKELVKWQLLQRYLNFGIDSKEALQNLGVQGLAIIACTGAFALVSFGVVISAIQIADIQPSFPNMFIFVTTYTLDVIVFVGSQLMVVVAFAETTILNKETSLNVAFRNSILYNFVLGVLHVNPKLKNDVTGSFPVADLFFTVIRAVIVYLCTVSFVDRFNNALSAESSQA